MIPSSDICFRYFAHKKQRLLPNNTRTTATESKTIDRARKWIWQHPKKSKISNSVSASHTIEIRIWRAIMFTWSGLLLIYGFSVILKKRRSSPARSFVAPRPSFSSRHQSICARPLTLFLPFLVGERRTRNLCPVILSFLYQILSSLVLTVVPSGSPCQSVQLQFWLKNKSHSLFNTCMHTFPFLFVNLTKRVLLSLFRCSKPCIVKIP